MQRCKALAKSTRERCRRAVTPGREVCHYHGGKSLRGIAHPGYKHGRYSKDLPMRMVARYSKALADPELLNLSAEIAIAEARIAELLGKVDAGEAGGLWLSLRDLVDKAQTALRLERGEEAARLSHQIFGLVVQGA